MARFSEKIINFLSQVGLDVEMDVSIVPKSESCARPGDFLFFSYRYIPQGTKRISVDVEEIFLVIQPVTKSPKTGNILLTGFKLPTDWTYTPDSLENLYNEEELPEDNYRTYVMSRMTSPLRKIKKSIEIG